MKNPKALLIGNDINNATASYSWSQLLIDLLNFTGLDDPPQQDNKPFPMHYEEIFLRARREKQKPEIELKELIALKTANMEPNEIHKQIMDLDVKDILTTNYDSTLEKCLNSSVKSLVNKGEIRETIYSLFRKYELQGKQIWHIHGSELRPRSIALGYEQYGGYLQQMRTFVATGAHNIYKNNEFRIMEQRLADGPITHFSWVDFFYTHDIYILGLNLDFVEMHLWWLLTYRARAMANEKISLQNSLYYFYPTKFEKSSRYKLDLLKVNGVKTIGLPMRGENRTGYYNRVLDYIASS